MKLTINKTENGDQTTFSLSGRFDATSAPQLETDLQQTLKRTKTLIFDLQNLSYISTTGLRVLLSAKKQMNRRGQMSLIHVGESVMKTLEIKGLSDVFMISDSI